MRRGLEHSDAGQAWIRSVANDPLVIGPMVLARHDPEVRIKPRPRVGAPDSEFIVLRFQAGGAAKTPGEGVAPPEAAAPECCEPVFITLLAPRRYLSGLLPEEGSFEGLPPSASSRILERYLVGLLQLDGDRLSEWQKALAASAVKSLLAAAFAPTATTRGGLGSRRQDALIVRIVAHIDANLREELTVDRLCSALGCSRAVLYRATTQAGGVGELILHRRLLAVHEQLKVGLAQGSIADLADAYGFSSVLQLDRRFKALFGSSPADVQRTHALTVEPFPRVSRAPRGANRQLARRPPCR